MVVVGVGAVEERVVVGCFIGGAADSDILSGET